jgi:hypothetical protein
LLFLQPLFSIRTRTNWDNGFVPPSTFLAPPVVNRTNFGIGGTPIRPNVVDTNPTTGRFGVANGPRTGSRTGQIAAKINF